MRLQHSSARILRYSLRDAGRADDEVRRKAEQQAEEDEPHHEHGVSVLAVRDEELLHDVEDRACGDREEDDRHRLARPGLAEHRAEERRQAADRAEERDEAPARLCPLAAHRSADAEALGRVVQAEADDERDGQAHLVRRSGLPDREALAEVVDADADRDQQRKLLARRERVQPVSQLELIRRRGSRPNKRRRAAVRALAHPLRVVDEAHQAEREAACTECGERREATPVASVQRRLDRIDAPESTSQSRKIRMPVASALSPARAWELRPWIRPTGSPRKIVAPAIAPRMRTGRGHPV